MRQALEYHNDAIGFGFWIPAFAGMTGVKPPICDSPAAHLGSVDISLTPLF